MNEREWGSGSGSGRESENKVVCKTLPINYKIPAAAPLLLLLLLPCLSFHAPSIASAAAAAFACASKVITKLLKPCRTPTPQNTLLPLPSSTLGIPLGAHTASSPAMKSSRCRCRNRNPQRICSCLSLYFLSLGCRIRCNWKGAGERSREQEEEEGGAGAAAVSRALEPQLKTFA